MAVRLFGVGLGPAEVAEALGNRSTGHESVPAAIYSAAVHESTEAAITFAVRCGGHTDIIGAMVGAIATDRSGAGSPPSRDNRASQLAPARRPLGTSRKRRGLSDGPAGARAMGTRGLVVWTSSSPNHFSCKARYPVAVLSASLDEEPACHRDAFWRVG